MNEVIQRAVYVLHTTIDETLAALPVADALAKAMDAPLTLVHFQTVPGTNAFVEQQKAAGTHVRVLMCRRPFHGIPYAFKPRSLVVVAGQRSWLPVGSERWRRRLEDAGHFVVFVDA
jgi:hypothetical protein